MHITILHFRGSGKPLTWSVKNIKQRAKEMGHEVKLICRHDCQMDFSGKKRMLLHKNKPYTKSDVIIIRPGFNQNYHTEAGMIKHLQYCGFTVVNTYLPVMISKNKVRTQQYLEYHRVPTLKTVVVHGREYLEQAVERIGKYPVIIKNASGSQGKGVIFVPDKKTLCSMMDFLMEQSGQEYLIQEYVKESKGKDIRVFVVGGKIVAAMERVAKKGEFRSNFHLGGSVQVANLSYEEKSIALKAAKVIGIEIAGVDILRTKEGPKIIEVNSNPGLEGITKASGLDVAGAVVKYSVVKAKIAQTKKDKKESKIKDKMRQLCKCRIQEV